MVADLSRSPHAHDPRQGCVLPERHEACPFGREVPSNDACEDPGLRSLLIPYALSGCSEDQEIAFEAHALVCDPCFRDLLALDRAGSLLTEYLGSR